MDDQERGDTPKARPESDIEASRRATFKAACSGLHPWRIAKALNRLLPGIDFRRMTKGALCREFVSGYLEGFSGEELRRVVSEEMGHPR